MKKSKLFFVSSEVYPFVKGGRGAEFAGSLPPYLQALGHEVRVLMPKYSLINERKHIIRDIIRLKDIPVKMFNGDMTVSVKSGFIPETKTQIYFADSEKYYKRADMYRDIRTNLFFKDNDERFIFLAKVAIETLKTLGWQPDIVHCCDWPTGLLPAMIRDEQKKNNFFKKTIVTFSINDVNEAGLFDKSVYEKTMITDEQARDKCLYKNKMSFLKAGIAFSDAVTVPYMHKRLKSIGKPANDFESILATSKTINDVPFAGDHNLWNPANNNTLYKTYSAEKFERKQTNKEGFLADKRSGFSDDHLIVGILAEDIEHQQKSITQVLKSLKDVTLQFFIIGNQNPASIGAIKSAVAKNDKHKIFTYHDPDDQFRHNFFAVCDLMYIPPTDNFSELYYLNGIHYGAIPLMHKANHVADLFDPIKEKNLSGNAFIFADDKELTKKALMAAEFFKEKDKWDILVKRVMKTDLSWNKFTAPFIKIYERALTKL
ncbi:glycogen/starch synthase [bacterium]|nr:glycogen/starch synthase [bacterium]